MAENRALGDTVEALTAFIKNTEQAAFALRCIARPSVPIADQSRALNSRAFEFTLGALMLLIKKEEDADLAAERITEKLKSFAADSVAAHESDTRQHATSSSSSSSASASSFTQFNTSPSSTEVQPTPPAKDQPTSSPHILIATWNLNCGARLPWEIAQLVGPYQDSSCIVLIILIKHGGLNHSPGLDKCRGGVPLVRNLDYYDYFGNERSMIIQREISRDQNGCTINIPHVACHQYYDLYNSMVHIRPRNLRAILHELRAELQTAIVYRAAVHAWYEALPANDERVAYNPRHSAFLEVFKDLEHLIEVALETNRLHLMRLG
jgi:hypothetical protein